MTVALADLPDVPMAAKIRLSAPALTCVGNLALLRGPRVAIVGAREVSDEGRRRTAKLAKQLVEAGVVVVSGLAKGVDHAAHTAAIAAKGSTIAVIGTPIDKAYPAENGPLQELIYREHLLISQFPIGQRVFPSNFPARNLLMAAITNATVIVEASDTSGSLHQAAECVRMNRPLFIARSVVDDPKLSWPARFLIPGNAAYVLNDVEDVLRHLPDV